MEESKKSLGQHWLRDSQALSEIVSKAQLGSNDTVLEIGPGLGTLTERICQSAKQVIAVEIDSNLATNLRNLSIPNLLVVEEDIRTYNLNNLPSGYKLVANIPYYLTSFLLRILFESSNPPDKIVVLVQKEVAERVAAKPGDLSILAISAQMFGKIELGRVVEAELFDPPPKVDSQILVITKHATKPIDVDDKKFFRLVKAGFSSKRKKLVNNLSANLGLDKNLIFTQLKNNGLKETARAQELSLQDWKNVYNHLRANL